MTEYTLWLPYALPPLTANQRLHWAAKARITADVRRTAMLLARAARLPRDCEHVTVALHYTPRDRRRRDPSNLMPTQKALIDGLAAGTRRHPGYGLVPDDTPDYVTETIPTIDPPSREAPGPRESRLYLTITTKGAPRA